MTARPRAERLRSPPSLRRYIGDTEASGEHPADQELADLGVARVAIPRRGRTGPTRRLVKWRTGCKGRISCLKHRFGWDRTLMDGIDGARIWCGHGVFVHTLVKLARLLQARHNRAA
jgi:transposase, IS5 family